MEHLELNKILDDIEDSNNAVGHDIELDEEASENYKDLPVEIKIGRLVLEILDIYLNN